MRREERAAGLESGATAVRLTVLQSHPVQYYAPLWRHLEAHHAELELTVIYVTSPAFFLWALDAKTGRPLENWGTVVPLDGFPDTGGLDLIPPLVADWGR